jgi:NADPH:quinone reductase-like Zn-dependent oxidoreductase
MGPGSRSGSRRSRGRGPGQARCWSGSPQDILREAAILVEADKLRPRLDPRRFSLSDVGAAHAAIEDRSAKGKIVVDMD